MTKFYISAFLLTLTGCTTTPPGVLEGGTAGAQGIVVGRITVLGESPALMLNFEARPLVGLSGSVTTEDKVTLVVQTLVPATYSWTEGRMVAVPQKLNLSGVLLPFKASRGCISYFGDITFDLSGPEPRAWSESRKAEAMAQAKAAHPKMFASNPVCQ